MKNRHNFAFLTAAVLCAFLLFGCEILPVSEQQAGSGDAAVLAEPAEDSFPAFPLEEDYADQGGFMSDAYSKAWEEWFRFRNERRFQPAGYTDSLGCFVRASVEKLLSDSKGGNGVVSPINLYFAFSMLAEVTEGETREQILKMIGAEDLQQVEKSVPALYAANAQADGVSDCRMSQALWLRNGTAYRKEILPVLAETYRASVYSGEMGSDSYDRLLREWLNSGTGGLLQDSVSSVSLSKDTALALTAAIYYRAKWSDPFMPSRTESDLFDTPDGKVEADFMHDDRIMTLYTADKFKAVGLEMDSDGILYLLLPNDGGTPEDLLGDPEALSFLSGEAGSWPERAECKVHLTVPKFDVISDMNLIPILEQLGATDVSDPERADFSGILSDGDAYLSDAKHAARLKIDEEGCEAAAYTLLAANDTGVFMELEEIDFTVDRPFLFALCGTDSAPLFIGLVNDPSES